MIDKKGYLTKEYKIFHIKDRLDKQFDFHYHDFYKIIIFICGDVEYSIEGKNYELKPEDIVLISKNEIHRPIVNNSVDYERIVLYLSASFLDIDDVLRECFETARKNHTNVMRLSKVDFLKLYDLLMQIKKKEGEEAYSKDLYTKIYLLESLLIINESVHENGLLFEGKASYDKKILEVCDYIEKHICDELSVDFLSKHFFTSKYYFMRKFKEYTGISLHQYILEKRILLTKQYVEEGQKIVVACKNAGFKDYSTYLRAKKRQSLRLVENFEKE